MTVKRKTLLFFTSFLSLFMAKDLYAQDWQNLGRYRDENAKLAPPAKDEKRVVIYTDNTTIAIGLVK